MVRVLAILIFTLISFLGVSQDLLYRDYPKNSVLASPFDRTGKPAFRLLKIQDIPDLSSLYIITNIPNRTDQDLLMFDGTKWTRFPRSTNSGYVLKTYQGKLKWMPDTTGISGAMDTLYVMYECDPTLTSGYRTNGDTIHIDTCYTAPADTNLWYYDAGSVRNKATTDVHIDTALTLTGLKSMMVAINDQMVLLRDAPSGNVYETSFLNLIDTIGVYNGMYKEELNIDAKVSFTLSFTLTDKTLISYNGQELRDYQWSGIGTNTLTLYLDTKQYDYLLVKQ